MFRPMLTSFCFVFNHFLRSRSREQASERLDESSGLGRLHFSSCYFLKRSKIDTSQNVKVSFATKLGDRRARASCSRTRVSSEGSGRKRVRPERLKKPASK